jgi:hypothetical protein
MTFTSRIKKEDPPDMQIFAGSRADSKPGFL